MTGAQLFVERLKDHGVRWVSTLCGHGLDPLFDACRRAGLPLIDTRNEQAASYMADAWGKLTRTPGVVAASSGVAHANALAGVVNACFDGSPMLLVTGAHAVATMGHGHFQDLDQVALAAPVCKSARLIDRPETIAPLLEEALSAAVTPRPGPVHLTFPMDVQRAEAPSGERIARRLGEPQSRSPAPLHTLPASYSRPLLIAGSGVFYAQKEQALARFCEKYAVPVVTPIWDRGCVNQAIPQFMGVIGAASGGPRLLPDADLILLCGAAADYRVGYLQAPAIHPAAHVVKIEPQHLGTLELAPQPAWLAEAQRRRDEFRRAFASVPRQRAGIHALDIIEALRGVLTEETVLLIDGGSIGQWCHQLLCDRYPGHWLTCGASGTVGWGLAGAMAARLRFPDRPVILVSGDGAATFTIGELECAVRQRLPFVFVVADDQAWGITRTGQEREFGQPIASELGPIDFATLAESLGARGVRVREAAQIGQEIRKGIAAGRAALIHVPIKGGNNLPQL
jgi:acetolactate synthase-1/2/3 large subunit